MTELNWVGPEIDIGQCCSMSGFVIKRLEKQGDGIKTNGTITTRDYGEHGWDFTHAWEATTKNGHKWVIEHDDLGLKTSTVSINECAKTRELLFRPLPYGSRFSQERLILAMILEFQKKGRKALEVPEYAGPMEEHTGKCFCRKMNNTPGREIWQRLTQGNFPKDCLMCSCGQGWHFHESRGWAKTSKEAFKVLAKYNGVVTRFMIIQNGRVRLTSETECHYR